MAFQRAFINLTLAVDLDGVPGMCDKPEDFVTIIEQALKGAANYKPELTVNEKVVKPYKLDDQTSTYIQPTLLEEVRKLKVGDKTYELGDGEGVITEIDGDIVYIKLDAGDIVDPYSSELVWRAFANRWEYGDLDRK